jgi:hypothetical protein
MTNQRLITWMETHILPWVSPKNPFWPLSITIIEVNGVVKTVGGTAAVPSVMKQKFITQRIQEHPYFMALNRALERNQAIPPLPAILHHLQLRTTSYFRTVNDPTVLLLLSPCLTCQRMTNMGYTCPPARMTQRLPGGVIMGCSEISAMVSLYTIFICIFYFLIMLDNVGTRGGAKYFARRRVERIIITMILCFSINRYKQV